MSRGSTARIKPFVRDELERLRADLHAEGMKIKNRDDIPNALILAARRSPIEAVKAVVETYWKRESEESGGPAE